MIRFTNVFYKRQHAKQPRGLGKWAFYTRVKDETLTVKKCPFEHHFDEIRGLTIIWASDVMTLTDAKNEVGSWFKRVGFNGILAVAE